MEPAGKTACGKCGEDYSVSLPACPKCGKPGKLNSLPVPGAGEGPTGRVTRLGRSSRNYHRSFNIRLGIPGKFILAAVIVASAVALAVARILFGWLGRRRA